MFRRSTRRSPFGPAAALLALLAAAHALPAQDAPPTVRADVANWTGKPIEFALVGPDGKDVGPARPVQYGYVYKSSNRPLPGTGYKWVVRDQASGRVLREAPADRAYLRLSVGGYKRVGQEPKETGFAQLPQAQGQAAPQARAGAAASRPSAQPAAAQGQRPAGGNRAELLRLINQHRQANGLAPLSMDASLTRAAQDHSVWMQSTGTFSHTGKGGSSMLDRIRAAGGRPTSAYAENIARNSSPQGVFDSWKNSAGHNRNMLGAYTKVGLGRQGDYYTAVFSD
jgi:uncharacterized protein YkwD